MYQLPNLHNEQQQLPNYQKIIQSFRNKIPTNFLLSSNMIYGQCLIQLNTKSISNIFSKQQQTDKLFLNQKRQRAKYITNKQQILLMLINQDNDINIKSRFSKNNCIRILFSDIVGVKLSVWYCGIMVIYDQYDGEDRVVKSVIIQDVDIGSNSRQYLRLHIIKYANKSTGSMGQYYMCTLLDYQLQQISLQNTAHKQQKKQLTQIKVDKHLSQGHIKRTKNINLKKQIQQINKQFNTQTLPPKNSSKSKTQQSNLLNIYTLYAQIIILEHLRTKIQSYQQQQQQKQKYKNVKLYRNFICAKQPNIKYAPQVKDLGRIKVILESLLVQNSGLLNQIYNQCQYSKNYQIITPYLPILRKVFGCGDMLVLQYKYYQGLTIRQLIKKDKINRDKKYLKDFLAQIVVAIGHIHQCGFVCKNVIGLDSIIVNYDGHVLFQNIGQLIRYENGKYYKNRVVSNQMDQPKLQPDQIVNSKLKDKLASLKNIKSLKSIKYLAPQQLSESYEHNYISDWWQLGMLIYQIITDSHIFQNLNQQQIRKQLTSIQKQLNFTLLDRIVQKNSQLSNLGNLIKNLLIKDKNKRLGFVNDYHVVLDSLYFKGTDKKKLTKRQGQQLVKIKKTKIYKQSKDIQFQKQKENGIYIEMKQRYVLFSEFLKQCSFDRDFQFGDS